jgi:hypothetical protein
VQVLRGVPRGGETSSPGAELVVFAFEHDVERGERSLTAGDTLLSMGQLRMRENRGGFHLP